jgi:cytochrome b
MKSERVWDPLVRLFHGSLIAAFATAWWGRGEAIIHETAGKVVIGLIIFRAVWGVLGPGSARFENFMAGPRTTLLYVLAILRGNPSHYTGHNPAGAAMIGLMLLTLVAITASGVLMTTTALWGNAWIEWIHGTSAYLMLVLIAGHLLGILAATIQHRENLIWSMITGWKWVPTDTPPYLGNLKLNFRRVALASLVILFGAGIWSGSTVLLNASVWRLHKTFAATLTKAGCETASVKSPRFEIYPAFGFHYDIDLGKGHARLVKTVSGTDALQRRPDIPLDDLAGHCATALKLSEFRQVQSSAPPVEQDVETKLAIKVARDEATDTPSPIQNPARPPARTAIDLAMAQSAPAIFDLAPKATHPLIRVKPTPPPAEKPSTSRIAVKTSSEVTEVAAVPHRFAGRKIVHRRKFIKAKVRKHKIKKKKVKRRLRTRSIHDGKGGNRSIEHETGEDRGGDGNRGRGGGGDGNSGRGGGGSGKD